MITTITLNVSVDKAYRIAGSIRPGTVSRVLECTNTAGGKGLNAVNTVGCGDSMVGAFAAAMKRNLPMEESLTYAVAVSAANAVNPETGHIRMKDVNDILPRVTAEQIL